MKDRIRKIIEDSELHYTVSRIIDSESFKQMIDELVNALDKELSPVVTTYKTPVGNLTEKGANEFTKQMKQTYIVKVKHLGEIDFRIVEAFGKEEAIEKLKRLYPSCDKVSLTVSEIVR